MTTTAGDPGRAEAVRVGPATCDGVETLVAALGDRQSETVIDNLATWFVVGCSLRLGRELATHG